MHRDLKPENVLLADDGRIKIGDFGLARAATANTATGAALLGTVAYLSPELVTRGIADTRSDIYAVGIMMYEMLTGEQPFRGEQPMQIAYQHANDAVPTPSSVNTRIPAELDELVLWATARDPEHRPRDARTMLDQLHDTEALIKTALPSTATGAQRTVVMPSSPARRSTRCSEAETQVIGPRITARAAAAAEVPDSTAALAVASQKRRGRGVWLLILVVVLAAVAGTTGWYFGAGPGSMVTIPQSIEGKTPAEAEAILVDLGFTVEDEIGTIDSPTVAGRRRRADRPRDRVGDRQGRDRAAADLDRVRSRSRSGTRSRRACRSRMRRPRSRRPRGRSPRRSCSSTLRSRRTP